MLQWDMAKESIEVWRCEYQNCKHAWISSGDDPPRRCAKCKKCNWHKTPTVKHLIRSDTWQAQIIEALKPLLLEHVQRGIAQEIVEAKRLKGAYVAQVLPNTTLPVQPNIPIARCNYPQKDYESDCMAYCGKDAGHNYGHGNWMRGEPLDP